jgi:hypothetical protein
MPYYITTITVVIPHLQLSSKVMLHTIAAASGQQYI